MKCCEYDRSLNSAPYDDLVYFTFLISPLLCTGLSLCLFYRLNQPLKKAAKHFIADACSRFKEFIKWPFDRNAPFQTNG